MSEPRGFSTVNYSGNGKNGNFNATNPFNLHTELGTPPPIPVAEDIAKAYGVPEEYLVIHHDEIRRIMPQRDSDAFLTILKPLINRFDNLKRFGEAFEAFIQTGEVPTEFNDRWEQAPKRRLGHLSTPSEIRREMANLYRESYQHGLEGSRFFTRMMYMLDCLLRAAQAETRLKINTEKPV